MTNHHERKRSKHRIVIQETVKPVGICQIFSYTNKKERALLCLGILACLGAGTLIPALDNFFGELANLMVRLEKNRRRQDQNQSCPIVHEGHVYGESEVFAELKKFAFVIGGVGFCHMFCCYCYITVFNYVSEKQSHRLKEAYLQGLFRQDISWHVLQNEKHDLNFASNLLEDIGKIQDATGEKLGLCLYVLFTSLFSILFALYHGPLLTLVVGSVAPLMLAISVLVYKLESKLALKEDHEFAKVEAISDESLSHIKAVVAFKGQEKELKLYEKSLKPAMTWLWKRTFVDALGSGVLWFLNFATYSLAFWYGSTLVLDGDLCDMDTEGYGVHSLMVCFNVIIATFEICSYFPYIDVFAEGCSAAAFIFHVCKRVPDIDPYSDTGLTLDEPITGKIEFKNVSFAFPSNPDKPAIKNLNLTIEPGICAVLGPIGSGKSLLLDLISRFYDPSEGQILIDDVDIREYNVKWLRSQIGIISQEPVLFNATIAENIQYGKHDATMEEIEEACKIALADDFIRMLPHGYDTIYGRGGVLLSHPHRQRIAIARALIRQPPILLFDEATDPLETRRQTQVLRNLIESRRDRTTIVVAELLSTITAADYIISLVNGELKESGTGPELLENRGFFYNLYERLKADTNYFETEIPLPDTKSNSTPVAKEKKSSTSAFIPSRSYSAVSTMDNEFIEEIVVDPRQTAVESDALRKKSAFLRILKTSRPECHLLIVGTFMAIILGCTSPLYALFFGKILGVFGWDNEGLAREKAHLYSLVIFLLGFVAGFSTVIQTFTFSWAGERLTTRLRKRTFMALMNQELAFYDQEETSTLYGRLSSDASSVQGATGIHFGSVFQALTTLISSICMSLWLSPRLGACTLIIAPSVSIATFFTIRLIQGQQSYEKVASDEVSKLACEAYNNIHTVAMLGKEMEFVSDFTERLTAPHKEALKLSHYLGIICGVSQSSIYFAYAFVIFIGSDEIQDNPNINYEVVFAIGEALTWCMLVLGQTFAFASNYSKATVSANRIFHILDRVPTIQSQARNEQEKPPPSEGKIEFEHVDFNDPSRPGAKILKDISFSCNPGERIAVVGVRDAGKSAIVQLILRLYDVADGEVLVDGKDVKEWDLDRLRCQMGVVFHEPYLFKRTIADNIAYGDLTREVTVEDIINAAKQARVHNFICDLPFGYKTVFGVGGNILSRAQMQKIALARAMIRNPKILLLDEATSNIDRESEKHILETFDAANNGRTCISVCTKLSNITNAKRILFINAGLIAEEGTHTELYGQKGYYYKLWNLQHMGFQLVREKKSTIRLAK